MLLSCFSSMFVFFLSLPARSTSLPPSLPCLTSSDACEEPTFCLCLGHLAPLQRLSGITEPTGGNDSLITRGSPLAACWGGKGCVCVRVCERESSFHCCTKQSGCSCSNDYEQDLTKPASSYLLFMQLLRFYLLKRSWSDCYSHLCFNYRILK